MKNRIQHMTNSIQLIGHLGRDPETNTTSNGTKFAKASLATNEEYKDKNGELVSQTQWHNIVAWGRQAEELEKHGKGSLLTIRGKLRYRKYLNKNGQSHVRTEILADSITHGCPENGSLE